MGKRGGEVENLKLNSHEFSWNLSKLTLIQTYSGYNSKYGYWELLRENCRVIQSDKIHISHNI